VTEGIQPIQLILPRHSQTIEISQPSPQLKQHQFPYKSRETLLRLGDLMMGDVPDTPVMVVVGGGIKGIKKKTPADAVT
jgi:hypothetical protein